MENVSETSYAAVPKLGPKSEICVTRQIGWISGWHRINGEVVAKKGNAHQFCSCHL